MITRKESWEMCLHDFVESRISVPFAWGTNDCCTFVADAVLAMTGADLAADYRSTYTTQRGAFTRIRRVTGGNTPEDVMAKVAKDNDITELPSVLFAQRGDVVAFDRDEGTALGIVYLNGKDALFVAPDGLHRIPVKKCRKAWGIR